MSCHVKIDPWGIALENYDALGHWRERVNGKPVDSTSRLFNNESWNGMDGLKRFLLKNRQDQFVRALTHKMMVYALGRPLTFADRNGVEAIAAKVRQNGDGLATLVLQITSSELFLSK
jgi:MFS superfamily sulfate permease-like transporter